MSATGGNLYKIYFSIPYRVTLLLLLSGGVVLLFLEHGETQCLPPLHCFCTFQRPRYLYAYKYMYVYLSGKLNIKSISKQRQAGSIGSRKTTGKLKLKIHFKKWMLEIIINFKLNKILAFLLKQFLLFHYRQCFERMEWGQHSVNLQKEEAWFSREDSKGYLAGWWIK